MPTKPQTRERTLKLLLPEPTPIETSQGQLYVRHLGIGDFSTMPELEQEAPDAVQVGRATLLRTCSTSSSGEDWVDLPEEKFEALTEQDLKMLCAAAAQANQLDELPDGPIVQRLGEAVIQQAKEVRESLAKTAESIKASLSWVGDSSRSAIAESLARMNEISQSLKSSSALESLRALGKISLPSSELQEQLKRASSFGNLSQMLSSKPSTSLLEAAGLPLKGAARNPLESVIPEIKLPPMESLPIGRAAKAAEETSQQVALVVTHLAEMGTQLNAVTSTILTKALPEWLEKLKEDRIKEKRAIYGALATLIISVLATIGTTYWQVSVGEKYQKDNDDQQKKVMEVMDKQLKSSEALRQQLAQDAEALRAQLTTQQGAKAAKGSAAR